MADYNHGTYGIMKDAVVSDAEDAATAVVAIGTLPVHLLPDYSGMVGVPLAMSDASAKNAYGYSNTWGSFTLCEVMQAFLGGAAGNIGGLYAINVLDPAKHKAAEDTEVTVTFTDGIGTITDELAILATIEVTGDTTATATYDWATGVTTIKSPNTTGAKAVKYRRVKPDAVTASDVVAAVSVLDDLYPLLNVIPNIIIAPGWSDNASVYSALVGKAQAISGHFFGFVLADIPSTSATATAEKAIAWKASQGYTSKFSKVCWPCVKDAGGVVYHLSTLFAREMARNDAINDGVPFVSASNTSIQGGGVCLSTGDAVRMYLEDGNALCEYGISTAVAWGGEVRLWGGHTAGYAFGASSQDASAIFDTNIRMLCYILNGFQTRWIDEIDEPMTLALQETILFSEQAILDGLVALGALVGDPQVSFTAGNNPVGNIVQGEFTWDICMTPTPQFKAARAIVAYTTDGLNAYIADSGTEEGE